MRGNELSYSCPSSRIGQGSSVFSISAGSKSASKGFESSFESDWSLSSSVSSSGPSYESVE